MVTLLVQLVLIEMNDPDNPSTHYLFAAANAGNNAGSISTSTDDANTWCFWG